MRFCLSSYLLSIIFKIVNKIDNLINKESWNSGKNKYKFQMEGQRFEKVVTEMRQTRF